MDRSLYPAVRPSIFAAPGYALRHHQHWLVHMGLCVGDQALIFLSFVLAYWMRYIADWPDALKPIITEVPTYHYVEFYAFLPVTLLLMLVLLVLFEMKRLYRLPRGSGVLDYAGIIVSSTLTGVALLIVLVFLYRPFYYSRLIFAFAGLNVIVLLTLWRLLLLGIRHWCWSQGIGQERVLVVGGNGLSYQVMNGLAAQPHLGYRLVGYLSDQPACNTARESTIYRYLGQIDSLKTMVRTHGIHQVILALPFWEHGKLPQLVQACRTLSVDYRVVPDLYELSFDRVDVQQISGVPLLGLKEVSLKGWNLALKRMLDVGMVVLSMPVTLPLTLLLALLIRLDSPGPALFRQIRIGKDGLPFVCYKFRTMVRDADKQKEALSRLNEADGPLFKIRHDPRVTRIGRFLRRSSLDELPQLWNVLRGEMSLVGPRPGLPEEVRQYEPWHYRRLEVTPGLTGLWQVLGRSTTTFDEMVRLDIYYAENWSVGTDLRILLMTIPAVIWGKGAY